MLSVLVAFVSIGTLEPAVTDLLTWRHIGPFRGGRTVGATGIPTQPHTFYIGVNNGGVWKTTDAGRTWKPIFDQQPTGSIGDVAIAPSDPRVVFAASGEGLQRPDLSTGNGMYRSDDAGKTWRHLGLSDAQQIGGIAVHPKNPNVIFAAVLGHPYGANETRGVYRSLDGGESWGRVLYKDVDTGAIQVTLDPKNPQVVYATLWEARQGPWENGRWQGPGSGLYKSSNGGDSWKQLAVGLPTFAEGLGRIGFAIAPSKTNILYATVDSGAKSGLYRSDDFGERWRLVNSERRLVSRGDDFAEVKVHPANPEIVYVADTSFYRSRDGGKSFTCLKGSPGGDDYHRIWINPNHPEIILLAADQGACISLNDGETWSSWYNQPTAQLYHVATDNAFPYNVYGGQQESGSAMVSSRGNDGQITFREWHPAGGDEYCYLAPDPLNDRFVYGGRVNRYDKVTGEVIDLRPKTPYRVLRTAPLLFSKADPKALFFAGNILFKTVDGGANWETLSPDLSRERADVPESIGKFRTPAMATMARRGVIYAVAPSPRDINVIWCGTDDGLLWVTSDSGKHWEDVTRNQLSSWSKVSQLDAGHFDTATCYAAINRIRLDDQKPHILRTHDSGKSWKEITKGLPDEPVNVVREDPLRKGLLYCGTENAVYYSLDDGENWVSLRRNMPATSIRDLVVHGNDLVVATHGRGFWICDNIAPLRELTTGFDSKRVYFFEPSPAFLIERNTNTDTPHPPDEPAGQNPPDGAMLDYWLPRNASDVTLEIFDGAGKLIRKFFSEDKIVPVDPKSLTVMPGWAASAVVLGKSAGAHRFVWDLRMPRPENAGNGLPISAIWGRTPFVPQGALVTPGEHQVTLTIDGTTTRRNLIVKMDPRKSK